MDKTVLYALQAWIIGSPLVGGIGFFLATILIWIEGLAVFFYFLLDRRRWALVLSAFISALSAWSVNQVIGTVWFRPRPFADLPDVQAFINKSILEKSFPSDHATIAFAIAFSVFLNDRRWGSALLVTAVAISFGRMLVGVHYLSDVFAGAFVGIIIAYLIHDLMHKILHTKHREG